MNILFSILSAAYIAGIFLFADSPMVSEAAPFNPYSLLHIPLYGILTLLLIFSLLPFHRSQEKRSGRLLIAGLIALVVAIADEIYQAYIPNRNASMSDAFLDSIGIILCLAIFHQFEIKSRFSNIMGLISRMTQKRDPP